MIDDDESYANHCKDVVFKYDMLRKKRPMDLIYVYDKKRCSQCRSFIGLMNMCSKCGDFYHYECHQFSKICGECCEEFGYEDSQKSLDNPRIILSKFNVYDQINEEDKANSKELVEIFLKEKIRFTDELIYPSEDVEKLNNYQEYLDGYKVNEINLEMIKKLKKLTNDFIFYGLKIEFSSAFGYHIIATKDLMKYTLIGEYTGKVMRFRDAIDINSDYMFDLIKGPFSKDNLNVDALLAGNLTRFISGVNNFDDKSFNKVNCESILLNIDGKYKIFIYTTKLIKTGEILYYDYNGYTDFIKYDTSKFI